MAQKSSKTDRILAALRPSRSKRSSPPSRSPTSSPAPRVSNVSRNTATVSASPTPPAGDGSDVGLNAKLWQQAMRHVETDDDWPKFKEMFLKGKDPTGIDSAIEQLEDAREQCDKQKWTITIGGRNVVLRDVVDSVVQYASIFKDVGATVVACDPTQHAALAWGLVQWLVMVRPSTNQRRKHSQN